MRVVKKRRRERQTTAWHRGKRGRRRGKVSDAVLLSSDLRDSSNHSDRRRAGEREREQGNSDIWANGESRKRRARGREMKGRQIEGVTPIKTFGKVAKGS